jgi:hypothetical protein
MINWTPLTSVSRLHTCGGESQSAAAEPSTPWRQLLRPSYSFPADERRAFLLPKLNSVILPAHPSQRTALHETRWTNKSCRAHRPLKVRLCNSPASNCRACLERPAAVAVMLNCHSAAAAGLEQRRAARGFSVSQMKPRQPLHHQQSGQQNCRQSTRKIAAKQQNHFASNPFGHLSATRAYTQRTHQQIP